jgi:hypothetical protein
MTIMGFIFMVVASIAISKGVGSSTLHNLLLPELLVY